GSVNAAARSAEIGSQTATLRAGLANDRFSRDSFSRPNESRTNAENTDADEIGGLFPRRIPKIELIYVTNQLAIMVETGITLSVALGSVLQEEQNPSLRIVLADLKKTVESGEDFSTALSHHAKVFNKTYISLIKASEATGTLGEMLNRISV